LKIKRLSDVSKALKIKHLRDFLGLLGICLKDPTKPADPTRPLARFLQSKT
jgi:hypothetical protein